MSEAKFEDFYAEIDKTPEEFLEVGAEVRVVAPENFLRNYSCDSVIHTGGIYRITEIDEDAVEESWDSGTYRLEGLLQGWVKADWVVPA